MWLWLDVGRTHAFAHVGRLLVCPTAGSLTESYDELGNRYQLPAYTLAPPVNLITESCSETKGSESAQKTAQPPPCRQEFQLRVRLSTGERTVQGHMTFRVKKTQHHTAVFMFSHACLLSCWLEIDGDLKAFFIASQEKTCVWPPAWRTPSVSSKSSWRSRRTLTCHARGGSFLGSSWLIRLACKTPRSKRTLWSRWLWT